MLANVINFRTESPSFCDVTTPGGIEKRISTGGTRLFIEIEVVFDKANASQNAELLGCIGRGGAIRLSAPDGYITEVVEKVEVKKPQKTSEGPDHW